MHICTHIFYTARGPLNQLECRSPPATVFCFMGFLFQVNVHAFNECNIEITCKRIFSLEKARFRYYFLHALLARNMYFGYFNANYWYVVATCAWNSCQIFGERDDLNAFCLLFFSLSLSFLFHTHTFPFPPFDLKQKKINENKL